MSDDEEGGGLDGGEEDPWLGGGGGSRADSGPFLGGGGSGGGGGGAEAEYGYLENDDVDADYNQVHQALAFQEKRRRKKRSVEAQIKADAEAKHSKVEADQLFPWRDDHPQDPRIMGVDYVVVNGVTYYCSVNLCLLLYRQAQTGQPVL